MTVYDAIIFFFVYGFFGWCCEVAYAAVKTGKFVNRGFLNGAICPIYGVGVTLVVCFLTPWKDNLILLYLASVILVTVLEGVTGYAMDKIFHNKWWDYSEQPLNIGGYVCLIFSMVWGVGCVMIVDFVHPVFARIIAFLPIVVGVVLIIALGILMFVDIYVTSSSIFKMNRRLASMEKVAKELHELSDQLGAEIFTQVTATMERTQDMSEEMQEKASELKSKYQDMSEEMQERAAEFKSRYQDASGEMQERATELRNRYQAMREHEMELKNKYQELSERGSLVSKRLVRAFPKMKARNHAEQFEKWREKLQEAKNNKRKKTS